MSWATSLLPLAVLLAALPCAAPPAHAQSTLAAGNRVFWRSAAAPGAWSGPDSAVLAAVRWSAVRPGLVRGELALDVNGGLLPLRVVIVRAALDRFEPALEHRTERGRAAWSAAGAPDSAALAVNAGQFAEAGPWGWLVLDGRVRQRAGTGPLTAGIAADSAGLRWLDADDVASKQFDPRWRAAFQSYPVLLRGGRVPPALAALDGSHRDVRLALGLAGDTLLIALTRYDGAGRWLARLPAGLTVPETAALMGALGARDALMLDGGLSAQLLVRDADGRAHSWPGLRRVPLGLLLYEKRLR